MNVESRDILGHMQMSCAPLKFPRYNALHISSHCIMLRASCLKYNLSPYLQTPNRRSTYEDRLILLKEALFEEQDRCSSLFLTRFDRNKSVAMSIERDERFSSRFSRFEISFIRRPVECKLDSVKVVQLLYAYMHSNSARNLKCTEKCSRRLEQRRESSSACFTRIRLYTVISWQ